MSGSEQGQRITVPGAHGGDGAGGPRIRGAPYAADQLGPPGEATPAEGVEQPDAVAACRRGNGEAAPRGEEEARVRGGGRSGGGHEEEPVEGRPRGHHGAAGKV
jgi:hypothetical protein